MKKVLKVNNWWDLSRRVVLLMVGLFFYGLAVAVTVRAGLGLGSWDVFHMGLSLHTPLSFGQAGQVTGLAIIAISFFLGIKPGIGTLANMFFIGFWIDLINNSHIIPEAASVGGIPAQLAWIAASLALLGLGSGMYIKAGMGAGPRDSFMLALVKRTGWRVAICRAIMEVTVCFTGWLMGGSVGIATLIIVFGIGPAVELGFKICRVPVRHGHEEAAPVASNYSYSEV
ncbi:MAG TPA: hypothetical protein VH186_17300 [Chloroflexia bacterium]|nr:hypothetical protein [Chloroflexia bacterium]